MFLFPATPSPALVHCVLLTVRTSGPPYEGRPVSLKIQIWKSYQTAKISLQLGRGDPMLLPCARMSLIWSILTELFNCKLHFVHNVNVIYHGTRVHVQCSYVHDIMYRCPYRSSYHGHIIVGTSHRPNKSSLIASTLQALYCYVQYIGNFTHSQLNPKARRQRPSSLY